MFLAFQQWRCEITGNYFCTIVAQQESTSATGKYTICHFSSDQIFLENEIKLRVFTKLNILKYFMIR